MIGFRRPNRSDSVPWVICPMARPAKYVARVICAAPGDAPSEVSIAVNAGRYISIEAGPMTVTNPSSQGSQEGNGMSVDHMHTACRETRHPAWSERYRRQDRVARRAGSVSG